MTVGIAAAVLNGWLDALCKATNYTAPTAFWVQLHTGDPGSAGTTSAFGDTTRKQATFATASGGATTTSADLAWTSLTAGGTLTHVSFWTASTSGTFLGSDNLASSSTVVTGDNFTIVAGDIDVAITPVAA